MKIIIKVEYDYDISDEMLLNNNKETFEKEIRKLTTDHPLTVIKVFIKRGAKIKAKFE